MSQVYHTKHGMISIAWKKPFNSIEEEIEAVEKLCAAMDKKHDEEYNER